MTKDAALSRPRSGPATAVPLAVRCVRALMERHGLPKYRQSPWLADALGLSYSQAHRRMTGASAWSLEDLERVGSLFGESLAAGGRPRLGAGLGAGLAEDGRDEPWAAACGSASGS